MTVVERIDAVIRRMIAIDPCTNVYGVGRSLIATSTLLTLAGSDVHVLFRPAAGLSTVPICTGFSGSISLFCLLHDHLPLARAIAIVGLAVVASGWRPRLTGAIHWWITFSLMSSSVLVDGGDQVASVLSLFLIPITLVDVRRWHWQQSLATETSEYSGVERGRRMFAGFALSMIRLQIAVIYLHAAVAKSAVPEWMNGTALYYWFTDPTFGAPSWLEPAVRILVTHGTALTLLTWSVVALEFSLFAGLFAKDRYLPILLVTGAFFHLGIALIHGLISFSIIMLGALILFLRPPNQEFHFLSVYDKLRWIYPIRKARRRMMLGGIPTTS
jgi:antimicrobial peptide system SdpB family protein